MAKKEKPKKLDDELEQGLLESKDGTKPKAKSTSKKSASKSKKKKALTSKKKSTKSKAKNILKKRGKPKKRGRKRGSKNTKRNWYVYIRSLVWKERQGYKGHFDSYFGEDFLWVVREINNECRATEERCSDETILEWFDTIADLYLENQRREKPDIPTKYFSPVPYWELPHMNWDEFDTFLHVRSDLIMPPSHTFEVTDYLRNQDRGYAVWFRDWVNYCNEHHRENEWDNSSDVQAHFKMTDSEYDEELKQWFIEIISCTSSGTTDDFGFNPNDSDASDWKSPEDEPQAGEETDEETDVPKEKEPEKDTTQEPKKGTEEDTEILKAKRRKAKAEAEEAESKATTAKEKAKEAKLTNLYKEKAEAKDDIKFWKELNDKKETDSAIKRLKSIQAKIDKILE